MESYRTVQKVLDLRRTCSIILFSIFRSGNSYEVCKWNVLLLFGSFENTVDYSRKFDSRVFYNERYKYRTVVILAC